MSRRMRYAAIGLAVLSACSQARPTQTRAVPSPSVYRTSIPRTAAPAAAGRANLPDFAVEYSVTPNSGIRIGSVVVVRLRIENRGEDVPNVVAYSDNGAHVRWEMVSAPQGNVEVDRQTVPPNRGSGTDGIGGVVWRLGSVKRGATVELTYTMRAVDVPCRGKGDYVHEFFGGHSGPIRQGPNSFHVLMFMQNDPEDIGELSADTGCTPISADSALEPAAYE